MPHLIDSCPGIRPSALLERSCLRNSSASASNCEHKNSKYSKPRSEYGCCRARPVLRELPVCTACSHAPLAGPIARKTSSAANSDTPYNEDSVKGGPSRRVHLKEVADRATCTGREPLRARQHSHIATNLRDRHSLPPPAVTKGGLSVNQRSAPTPQRAA
jgi:hypothetical protein